MEDAAEVSLRDLGLREDQVREAVGAGNTARLSAVGKHCAKSAPGYLAWNGVLTSLSQQLCAGDWKRHDPQSLPVLLNRTTKVLLTVSSGNNLTGRRGPRTSPSTKNPKGELTRDLQRNNRESTQEPLFEASHQRSTSKFLTELEDFKFWVFLVHFDKDQDEIRYEISRPLSSDSKGYTCEWYPRLVQPPYALKPGSFNNDEDPNEGFGIDVPVEPLT